ncbi:hypothetical protein [Micromonospora rubida]|uniref:hypothetical protein n=1 Tax=Micromonospora rubida TaxID=2697657 RepID=UPI0013782F64|nr:hypothetical protein [Micromonospora rubida]NBE83359.1 hypothetical protein [Micromonospora rubida]
MPDEVQVDREAIRKLGEKFLSLAELHVDPGLAKVPSSTINPGVFADADDLRLTFNNRRDALAEGLANIKKALHYIGDTLEVISKKYEKTDGDTGGVAAELDALVERVRKDLPGIKY